MKILTRRQKELLRLIDSDLGYKQIALQMGISRSRVNQLAAQLHRYFGTGGSRNKLLKIADRGTAQCLVEQTMTSPECLWEKLTVRQRQMSLLYALGYLPVKEVGKLLGVKESTITVRMATVYRSMGMTATKRVGLVRFLAEQKLMVDDLQEIMALCPKEQDGNKLVK